MIKLPTTDEYDFLKAFKDPYCLTVNIPYVDSNATSSSSHIAFKNLIVKGEDMLKKKGATASEIRKMFKPAHELIEDSKFWQDIHAELVFYIASGLFQYFHLPNTSGSDHVTLGTEFELRPLEAIIHDNKHYYILTISHHAIQMYEGDNYKLKPLQINKLPNDMKHTLNIDEFPQSRQLHSIAPASTGKGSEGYHQQYDVTKTDKNMLLEYFRRIDKILHKFLKDKKKPLIIGGVEYLLPMYFETNTYPHIIHAGIKGNLERINMRDLHCKAMNVLHAQSV